MSIVVRFHPSNLTAEKYNEVLETDIDHSPDGRDYHVCFGTDGNLTVSEIWDSREKLEEYGKILLPVLEKVGIEMSGEPEVFEVENIRKR